MRLSINYRLLLLSIIFLILFLNPLNSYALDNHLLTNNFFLKVSSESLKYLKDINDIHTKIIQQLKLIDNFSKKIKDIKDAKNILDELSLLKNDFEILIKDLKILTIKFETFNKTLKIDENVEINLKNINLLNIAYEVIFFESTINSKKTELKSLDLDITYLSSEINNTIKELNINPNNFENYEIEILNQLENPNISDKDLIKLLNQYLKFIRIKLLKYKVFYIETYKKFLNYEIEKNNIVLEQKKQFKKFIEDNEIIFEVNKKLFNFLTNEIEIYSYDFKKEDINETLKKINALNNELTQNINLSDNSWKKKYIEKKLKLEQEYLKHKIDLFSEQEEKLKFANKFNHFTSNLLNKEATNIQNMYFITTNNILSDETKTLIISQLNEYKKQTNEIKELIENIKSNKFKIENLIKFLNNELTNKNLDSGEITLIFKNTDFYNIVSLKEQKIIINSLNESLTNLINIINQRVTINTQFLQNLSNSEKWLLENQNAINKSIKLLSSLLNQLEERIDLKTIPNAYNEIKQLVWNIFKLFEEKSLSFLNLFLVRDGIKVVYVLLKNLLLIIILSLIIYFLFLKVITKVVIKNNYNVKTNIIKNNLIYIVSFIGINLFSLFNIKNDVIFSVIIWTTSIILLFKIILTIINLLLSFNFINSELYFKLTVFTKYIFISSLVIVILDTIPNVKTLSILLKFLFKFGALILLIILFRNYFRTIIGYLYIPKHYTKSFKGQTVILRHFISLYNHLLYKYHGLIIFVLVCILTVFFAGYTKYSIYILKSSLLTLLLYSVLFLVPLFAKTTFKWLFLDDKNLLELKTYEVFKIRVLSILRITYKVLFIFIFIVFTLKIWGINIEFLFKTIANEVILNIGKKTITILLIILASFISLYLIEKLIDDFFKNALSHQASENIKKRGATIAPLLKSTAKYFIWFFGIYLVLKESGIDVTPIAAGAGIFALAIGFGSQNLVKDIVAGFFIIFEDQYNVGDFVTIEGISGTIEELSIRITKIRDVLGTLHVIPNGSITKISNFSKDFSISRFEVSVSYENNFDKVMRVIEKTALDLCNDWNLFVITPTKVIGIINFGDSEVVIRTETKLTVGKRIEFECELRRRLLKAFQENQIPIPYKRIVVISNTNNNNLNDFNTLNNQNLNRLYD